MSFWDNLFTSDKSRANEDIYADYNSVKNVSDAEKRFGLKRRKSADVSKIYNPARATLATRQAQANAAAGARMSGSNATPQTTFGGINSQFATAFGDLESDAAKTGLSVERGDEQLIADYFDRVKQQRSKAAEGLSDTSPFNDILGVAATAAKFINPAVGVGLDAINGATGGSKIDPSQFLGQDYSGLQMPTALSPKKIVSPLNSSMVSDTSPVSELTQSLGDSLSGSQELDDGSWGMKKKHGFNNKLGKFGWWTPGNTDVNFGQ